MRSVLTQCNWGGICVGMEREGGAVAVPPCQAFCGALSQLKAMPAQRQSGCQPPFHSPGGAVLLGEESWPVGWQQFGST